MVIGYSTNNIINSRISRDIFMNVRRELMKIVCYVPWSSVRNDVRMSIINSVNTKEWR